LFCRENQSGAAATSTISLSRNAQMHRDKARKTEIPVVLRSGMGCENTGTNFHKLQNTLNIKRISSFRLEIPLDKSNGTLFAMSLL
jgi:hypothetical protein